MGPFSSPSLPILSLRCPSRSGEPDW
ncbi:hypothetical protein LINGRAHAP2_LOCUS14777 [Linum grandiflorum]